MPTPRKRFGQHFLCDTQVIARIVAALAPKNSEHLIEIGPGQGALTLPVLHALKKLEVIELDRDLILDLQDRYHHQFDKNRHELVIYSGDVLAFDFAALKTDTQLLRVFGNLPYNISTPLIFHLLTYTPIISDMLFMLQKEVADRMSALVRDDTYGRLSVMVQYHCEVESLFDVAAAAFYPPPKVTSSIVRLLPYREKPYLADDEDLFAEVVKQAFGQRRKTLRNSLKNLVTDTVWESLPIGSHLRAENLSVQEFVLISNAIKKE